MITIFLVVTVNLIFGGDGGDRLVSIDFHQVVDNVGLMIFLCWVLELAFDIDFDICSRSIIYLNKNPGTMSTFSSLNRLVVDLKFEEGLGTSRILTSDYPD